MATFPSNVGGQIPLKEAQERIENFKKKYPEASSAFTVTTKVIKEALQVENLTGLRFCLGQSTTGEFAPVIGGSTLKGEIIDTFDTKKSISRAKYEACSSRWQGDKPYDLNWVFMGSETLMEICNKYPNSTINVCADLNGEELNMCFLIQEFQGINGEDCTECAYNKGSNCPPTCN